MRFLILVSLALGLMLTAAAGVVYDNGAPPIDSGSGTAGSTWGSSAAYDSFVLMPSDSTISDLHWYGYGVTGAVTDFMVTIYANSTSNRPDFVAPLVWQQQFTDVASLPYDASEREYSVEFDPLTLAADTTYWLSIAGIDPWRWSVVPGDTGYFYYQTEQVSWGLGGGELGFRLTDDAVVPEPAAALLAALGLLGVAIRRRCQPDGTPRGKK